MEFLFLIIGLAVGVGLGFLWASRKSEKPVREEENPWQEKWHALDKEKSILQDRIDKSLEVFQQQKAELEQERERNNLTENELSRWKANYKNLEEKLAGHQQEVESLQQKFATEFENIAAKILKQNTTEFVATNSKNLDEILNPLKEKIVSFERKVEETHKEELRDKASLKQEVRNLMDLNKVLSEEARNLTSALKGDNKQQGNWGELVLERVLERSGLIKGEEYVTQYHTKTQHERDGEKGSFLDAVVFLPDNKHIVIDSKVSLLHFEAFSNSEDHEDQASALKAHIESVRSHIRGLGDKRYYTAQGLNTPDFVLLFFPIEPALNLALKEDTELWQFGWDKNIVLVSPTTLLATLKTVASVWKFDRQTRNALEIARQGGALYEKFVGFLADLQQLERHLDKARESYDESVKKLATGKGNLVRRVEQLRELGVKTEKQIPDRFALENENLLEE